MYKYGLKRKSTLEDIIIYLDNQPKIKYPNIAATKVMNSFYYGNIDNFIDNIKSYNIKKSIMLDKATQKDYVVQNYDLFPDMYYKIDAQSKNIKSNYKNKKDKITQTIRYILKDMPTPYSSVSSFDKPPSTPPDEPPDEPPQQPSREPSIRTSSEGTSIIIDSSVPSRIPTPIRIQTPIQTPSPIATPVKRTPTPTPPASEVEEEDVDGIGDMSYTQWLINLLKITPPPSPPRTPTPPPQPIQLTDEQIRTRSRSRSGNGSASSSSHGWNERNMRERSRSRDS